MSVVRKANPTGYYQPLFELGQGGMGAAYLARALGAGGFERFVVVKRLHEHLLNQPDAQRRFLDEARLAAYVHHANVVGVHQAGSDAEGQFIVLDYVEGGSLDEIVDRAALRGATVPVPIVLRIFLDALAGLQAIHDATDATGRSLSILHRDISPQNILVGRDGVARLADFGIAKSSLGSVSTDKGYIIGKLLFMPPEYLRRTGVDRRLDVYAMGMSMWVVLAGNDPWPDIDEGQLVTEIVSNGVPPVSSVADVPPQVDAIVSRACAMDANDRFQSAREMSQAIEEVARFTGWMASHAEVSAFVEQLLGHDLARRRERVSSVLQTLDEATDDTVRTDLPAESVPPRLASSVIPFDLVAKQRSSAAFSFSSTQKEGPSARWIPAVLVALGGIAAAGGYWFWQNRESTSSTPAASTSSPSRIAVSAAPVVVDRPTLPAQHSVDAGAPSVKGRLASPLPAATRVSAPTRARTAPAPPPETTQPPPPPAPVERPEPPPSPPKPSEPASLDGITKTNPYR